MHHFYDEFALLEILPLLNKEIPNDVPIEEPAEVTLEEKRDAMDETESKVDVTKDTAGNGMRKRTRSSTKIQAGPNPATKKAKGKAPISSSLKLKNVYNNHFCKGGTRHDV